MRGGSRVGAGRPRGTGKFSEPTRPVRIPESSINSVFKFIAQKCLQIPLCDDKHLRYVTDITPLSTWYAGDLRPDGTTMVITVSEELEDGDVKAGDKLIVVRKQLPQKGDRVITQHDNTFHIETATDDSPVWGIIRYIVRAV